MNVRRINFPVSDSMYGRISVAYKAFARSKSGGGCLCLQPMPHHTSLSPVQRDATTVRHGATTKRLEAMTVREKIIYLEVYDNNE
jgi:hypothetical protein